MPAQDRSKERWPLYPIEGWRGKLRFGQRVEVAGLSAAEVGALEALEGTTYGQWELRETSRVTVFANYTYYDTILDRGDLIVIWSPPVWSAAELALITEQDRARGRLLRRYHLSRQHPWPAVLHDLMIEVGASSAVPRRNYQDDVSVSVPVQVSEYVTDIAPSRRRVRCHEPIPGEVHGTYRGTEIHFPACLHPRIEMDSIPVSGAALVDCTPDRSSPAPGTKRVFAATNYEYLAAHVYQMEVREDKDLYFLAEYKVFPPEGIPEIEA